MKVKYPRTFHLPQSPGATSDDKILKSLDSLIGQEVVITEKMDGENTTLYTTGYHARSIDSRHHPSRDWLAKFHATVGYNIPSNIRVCGENLYAKHSIYYTNLKSYFLGFSIWKNDTENVCLSWDDTVEWFELLDIQVVPTLYRGVLTQQTIDQTISNLDLTKQEGFVVRTVAQFAYEDFDKCVAKWVRKGHVETSEHWMHSTVVPNQLLKQ